MKMSVKAKLILLAVFPAIFFAVLMLIVFPSKFRNSALEEFKVKLDAIARINAQSLVSVIDFDSREEGLKILQYNDKDHAFLFARVYSFDLSGNEKVFVEHKYSNQYDPVVKKLKESSEPFFVDENMILIKKEITNSLGEQIGTLIIGNSLEEVKEASSRASRSIIWFAVIMIGIAAGVGYLFSHYLSKPIEKMVRLLKQSAEGEGDLTYRIQSSQNDEIGEMAKYFDLFVDGLERIIINVKNNSGNVLQVINKLRNQFEEMITQLDEQSQKALKEKEMIDQFHFALKLVEDNARKEREYVEDIQRVVQEMMSVITDMVRKSEVMQDMVAKTSASIEEMGASIEEVSANIQSTNQITAEAANIATNGKNIVYQTVDSMKTIASKVKMISEVIEELNARSNEINEIVGVIEEVADQTNLLALNAAIEAARAGEAGKGFAVVADEIRKLAERTSSATKEIAQMIRKVQESTQKAVESTEVGMREVEKGLNLSDQSEKALDKINQGVMQVSHIMEEISLAIQQQAQGTHQIIEAVNEMRETTEQVIYSIKEQANQGHHVEEMVGNIREATEETSESVNEQTKQLSLFTELVNEIVGISEKNREQIRTISDILQQLSTDSKQLSELVGKFTVSNDSRDQVREKSIVKFTEGE